MKILILSDTHGKHNEVPELPEADLFIYAGDFCNSGRYFSEIQEFNFWLNKVPVAKDRRLIVAGNHDISLDGTHPQSSPRKAANARELITNGVYVQDQEIMVDGHKIYMSPWTPYFLNWGFNAQRGPDIKAIWDKIPDNTEILVTHGPPKGILDIVPGNSYNNYTPENVGCDDLSNRIAKLPNLKMHIFGHVHEPRGILKIGNVTYINASFLNDAYRPHPGDGYFLVDF